MLDAYETITKAPEVVRSQTEAEAQQAREEAAPAYLKGRVERHEQLPYMQVEWFGGYGEGEQEEDQELERWTVYMYILILLKHDLFVELMEGLRLR